MWWFILGVVVGAVITMIAWREEDVKRLETKIKELKGE